MRRTSLTVTIAALALTAACGDEPPPVCPSGDCSLPGSTIIKWKFNGYPELGFGSDSCLDLGVSMVRVELYQVEDPAITEFMDRSCNDGQLTFLGLEPGTYTVAVTPLDADGNVLVKAAAQGQIAAATSGALTEVTVNVPYTAWEQAYTGQLLYRLSWGGPMVSCDAAMPVAVATQTVTLTVGGQVVSGNVRNDRGDKLDGTMAYACYPFTAQFPQSVMGLPMGPATLEVVGMDAMGVVIYEGMFDTFVGAGVFNPTLSFDVPAVPAPPPPPPPPPPV